MKHKTLLSTSLVAITLFISGCEKPSLVSEENSMEHLVVAEINPPKHASITFKRPNGELVRATLGKRCSNYNSNVNLGDKHYLQFTRRFYEYKSDGRLFYVDTVTDGYGISLKNKFCY